MGALVDYAAYFTEDAAYPDDVIFNIPIRVKKMAVEGGMIEALAYFYGWQPTDTMNAPDRCIEEIKKHVRAVSYDAIASYENSATSAKLAYIKEVLIEG
jgi:hypothetical protein